MWPRILKQYWSRWRSLIVGGLIGLGLVLNLLAIRQFLGQSATIPLNLTGVHVSSKSLEAGTNLIQPPKQLSGNSTSPPTQQVSSSSKTTADAPKRMYGHFYYQEANVNQLMVIASYAQGEYQRYERLAPEASLALMKLIYAARDDGVWIIPVSGFRNVPDQKILFEKQIERRGSVANAAKVSAPPGYSEHHTGYAVDLADGSVPTQDISREFESTRAYQWLRKYGNQFGFELSFPENNAQGISYEPWHWRYVESPTAAAIFAQARR